jgi:hypothetical protein
MGLLLPRPFFNAKAAIPLPNSNSDAGSGTGGGVKAIPGLGHQAHDGRGKAGLLGPWIANI